MIPEVGQRFGPYEILGKLGSGAMGVVLRAWDARLHREVAIKLLHSEYEMPGMRERFLQEARAVSALNHPNICTIFDLGEQDGEPYMVMELLEGETLKEKISRGAVPADEIISYAQEVADALGAAHAKGIVHRDIKPANIFLVDQPSGRKQAKVLDFGLAKIGMGLFGGRASRALDLTLAGATVGTLSYMSPEQARGQTLDERSDLFSLGVVMYEMATRQVPFQGATSALIFVQLLNHDPEPLHDWNDSIPKDLEKIILRLLSKDRGSRFQTATSLGQALRKIPFRSGGGWLKRAAAAVPLVKAADPVARSKRPLRPVSDQNRVGRLPVVTVAGPAVVPAPAPILTPGLAPIPAPVKSRSSADNMLIRPVPRSPLKDGVGRDEGVLRGTRPGSSQTAVAQPAAPSINPEATPQIPAPTAPSAVPLAVQQAVPEAHVSEPIEKVEVKPVPVEIAANPALVKTIAASEEGADVRTKSGTVGAQIEFGSQMEDAPNVTEGTEQPPVSTPEPARPSPPKVEVVRAAATRREPIKTQPKAKAELQKDREVSAKQGKLWTAITAALLVVFVAGGILLFRNGSFKPVLLKEGEPLLLTVIQNRTDDKTLNGTVMEGLELELEQSQYLTVRGGEAYRAGLKQVEAEGSTGGSVSSRRVAQLVGAKAYLYGEVTGTGAPFMISVDVLKTDSNDKLTNVVEQADGRDGIAAAIGRVANRVRADMGESDRTISKSSVPLEKEVTANLEALQAFSLGEDALQSGRTIDAIAAFESAAIADPKFAQAHLRLAWLYRAEHAESSAAAEAKLARDSTDSGSERLKLLAEFCYELNASGDFARAAGVIKQFKELFPHDDAGLLGQSQVLRVQGHVPEALQAAQQAYSQNAYNGDAYAEAVPALIAMDRYTGALQLQDQATRLGVARHGNSLAAAYLAGNKETLAGESAKSPSAVGGARSGESQEAFGRLTLFGLAVDNDGRLAAGEAIWRKAASSAKSSSGPIAGLSDAEPYLLAQAALDRALTRSCGPALEFAREAGRSPLGIVASFNAGMALALCNEKVAAEQMIETIQQRFPKSSAATDYYVADLRAAIGLDQKDMKGALASLGSASSYDTVSLTPYLRGLAHMGTGEAVLAVADFQTVLDHRGAAFLAGSDVYPMAQIGLARAYAAIGDKANSAAAYRSFAGLWKDADRGQGLLEEAMAKQR